MIKFLHIRAVDEDGNLLTKGGATLAYTTTPKEIMLQSAVCHSELDAFCYRVGRLISAGRLKSKKYEPTIIERKDPIGKTLVEWAQDNLCVGPIEIVWNDKAKRWESTFFVEAPDAEFDLAFKEDGAQMDSVLPPPI